MSLVCRVGGCKFSTLYRSTRYLAREFAQELNACFGISVDRDEEDVHPSYICAVCQRVVAHYQDAVANSRPYTFKGGGCGEVQLWTRHSRTNCDVCNRLEQQSFGGRPKKRRRIVSKGALSAMLPAHDQNELSDSEPHSQRRSVALGPTAAFLEVPETHAQTHTRL